MKSKRLLHLFGFAVCIALLAYLSYRAVLLWESVSSDLKEHPPWLGLTTAILLSALAYIPLSIGWLCLLPVRFTRSTLRGSLAIVLLSQAARYFPGNIGHFIGKVIMTRSWLTISLPQVMALVTLELLLCLLCALAASAFGFPYLLRAISLPTWLTSNWSWLFAAGTATLFVLPFVRQPLRELLRRLQLPSAKDTTTALVAYGTNVVLGGMAVLVLVLNVYPESGMTVELAILAYSTAWLAGFVMPGAPAGLGVREFVFVLILGPVIGEPKALLVAGLLRLAAVLGDTLAFGAGAWLKARGYPEPLLSLR